MPRHLAGALAAAAAAALAGCGSAVAPDADRVPPTYRITGVEVRPIDRVVDGATVRLAHPDTLRGQVAFWIVTTSERVAARARAVAPASADPMPGFVANPTVPQRSWLSVDRPVRHRGVEIPAHTNLLAVPAVRESFDGATSDLLVGQLSPFAIGEAHLRARAFAFAPGPYVFTFRWETAAGEAFGDTVAVHVDLASP